MFSSIVPLPVLEKWSASLLHGLVTFHMRPSWCVLLWPGKPPSLNSCQLQTHRHTVTSPPPPFYVSVFLKSAPHPMSRTVICTFSNRSQATFLYVEFPGAISPCPVSHLTSHPASGLLSLLSYHDGVIMTGVDCINKPLVAEFTLRKKKKRAEFVFLLQCFLMLI